MPKKGIHAKPFLQALISETEAKKNGGIFGIS
jgi:hypothetical protein